MKRNGENYKEQKVHLIFHVSPTLSICKLNATPVVSVPDLSNDCRGFSFEKSGFIIPIPHELKICCHYLANFVSVYRGTSSVFFTMRRIFSFHSYTMVEICTLFAPRKIKIPSKSNDQEGIFVPRAGIEPARL